MPPQTRINHPPPSNVGEPQSVRDAYQQEWDRRKNLPVLRPSQGTGKGGTQ
ncbi:hypothetical protein [Microbispora sp. H10949]|uniref:hypothetical protein n=1 Tax=Microbispora sp. H10949 TaxID=2729111 RepID=UPI0016038AC5|nr:hypothetical protein [Microbispora sp. H10949]